MIECGVTCPHASIICEVAAGRQPKGAIPVRSMRIMLNRRGSFDASKADELALRPPMVASLDRKRLGR